jgi:glutathione S-transferase
MCNHASKNCHNPLSCAIQHCFQRFLIRHRSRYKLVEIDLYGSKPQWFLDLNPKGLVPVLRHDGHVISESNDICEYLEQLAARSTSTGAGASGAASAEVEWIKWGDAELLPKGRRAILSGSAADKSAMTSALKHLELHLGAQPAEKAVGRAPYL